MKPWTDLLLTLPLPEHWLRGVLFLGFGLHLLFALLMLGTAMLGVYFFLRGLTLGRPDAGGWHTKMAHSHLVLKSLAVVLGVAPLLAIQVFYSEEFFTATGLFAYAWMAVIPLLVVAFLGVEAFGHKLGPAWLHLGLGLIGLTALMTVPAVFTGALALLERPERWARAAAEGLFADGATNAHWLLRYLHVLGAALIFGGTFHLLFTVGDDPERAAHLKGIVLAAVMFQAVVGVPLIVSMDAVSTQALAAVTVGVAAAMALIWIFAAWKPGSPGGLAPRAALALLPLILAAMLAGRQWTQDAALAAVREQNLAERARQAAALAEHQQKALAAFETKLRTVYDNGPAIYQGSCAPCHGEAGRGDGAAARELLIPAENLAEIRADRQYVRSLVLAGIPGSDMPYFTVFDKAKIDSLLAELDSRFAMFAPPAQAGPVPAEAARVFGLTCAVCHGQDGTGNAFGETLSPRPPDLSRYALTPERTLAVISEGYPGTAMQPYRHLPEELRRGLAAQCAALRRR